MKSRSKSCRFFAQCRRLLSLQPGVTTVGNVNGGRSDTANVTLDGVDVNEQQAAKPSFSVLRTTPDSLQEFRVTTDQSECQRGRSSGAQDRPVTKSGTNQFPVRFLISRNTHGTANNWSIIQGGALRGDRAAVLAGLAKAGDEKVPRPALIRNNFAGRLAADQERPGFLFLHL